ncbi:unnamed protein product (macronuclear) [Paramecium tetraurelia]|uniref:Ubiquitin-like domain-containing protein n=1 Tax=Paramecium tetraurelia TaxID=5888 RepID=A0CHC7_PARTE|nr:uncharacterized protein GSPATT00038296001 [Paramecium tetraurelia]CAK70194.1 unnamed protein product [Paramecium tetraurelia]|eukprot:XP_001437591.1 hypothetical protein (macronuclear) [Paramecium tetraurelia strain d4-2]
MNQLMGQNQRRSKVNESNITVNIAVSHGDKKFNLQTCVDPEWLFNVFINGIKECINCQVDLTQFKLKGLLLNDVYISQNDSRTLKTLGFTNYCTLFLTFIQNTINKRIYKVQVELKVKKIELFIEQIITTPISCVFHDILVELFQNHQLKIARPLAIFINGTEIQPYDLRQIIDFQTGKGITITIKSIDPNQKPNKSSIEKFQFALYKSKKIQRFSKKQIKIQLNDDMEVYDYNDLPLVELIQKHVTIKQTQYFRQIYFINDVILFELENIHAINDFKLEVLQLDESQEQKYYFFGDFQKKYKIRSIIDQIWYYFEEYIPINTSKIELQNFIKHNLFGPNYDNYKQELIILDDELIINYSRILN